MSDEIETIDKNPKSWAAWKREAERLQGIIDGMALAAMDSEPHTDDELSNLLWYSQEATCHSDPNYYCEFQRLATPGLIAGIIRELHERRKADSEPVADVVAWSHPNEERKCDIRWRRHDVEPGPLYRHAQPAPERDQVRSEHAEWSQATFGNVGPIGPLKHLSKEALEAAAEPGDLSEWADIQFLLWDAQRRAGITDEQITQAMIEKLAVNKLRDWPEPKDGEPRLHIKEQPAPVVPCPFPCGWDKLNKLAIQNSALVARYLSEGDQVTEEIRQAAISNNDSLLKVIAACRAAMLQAGALTNEDTRQVDELTMWIKRLVRSLKNTNPDSKLPREAMDYLTAKGLISVGDILR